MASQEDALKSTTGVKARRFQTNFVLRISNGANRKPKTNTLAASASSAAHFLEIVRVDTSYIYRFK